MYEIPFTGLILAGLLDPGSAPSVYRALLVGLDPFVRAVDVLPVSAYCPSSGVDLVIEARLRDRRELLLIEHKWFTTASHVPRGRSDPEALWQTDQAYIAVTSGNRCGWLMHETGPDLPARFVVLDCYGRSMAQLYPGGLHNEEWAVTSYEQFGEVLRAEHEAGVRGLIPLLSILYAGSPESKRDRTRR